MINPLELRLGNYVLYNGQIAVVSGINSPAPRKDKNFDGKYVIELVLGGLIDCTPEELEPITLTEELLLKFEFERKSYTTRGVVIEVIYYKIENIVVYLMRDFFEIEIITSYGQFNLHKTFPKNLHRLQNIIKELTGQELEINKWISRQ